MLKASPVRSHQSTSSRASPPIPAQAFTDFGVESLVELIKIHRESTSTESAEINDERRPAAAYPGRLLRILMKFVNKP